jgi:hypothetical protein
LVGWSVGRLVGWCGCGVVGCVEQTSTRSKESGLHGILAQTINTCLNRLTNNNNNNNNAIVKYRDQDTIVGIVSFTFFFPLLQPAGAAYDLQIWYRK